MHKVAALLLIVVALQVALVAAHDHSNPVDGNPAKPPICYHIKTGVLKLAHAGKPICAEGWVEVNLNEFLANPGDV